MFEWLTSSTGVREVAGSIPTEGIFSEKLSPAQIKLGWGRKQLFRQKQDSESSLQHFRHNKGFNKKKKINYICINSFVTL